MFIMCYQYDYIACKSYQLMLLLLHVHSFLFILLKGFKEVVVLQFQFTACKSFVKWRRLQGFNLRLRMWICLCYWTTQRRVRYQRLQAMTHRHSSCYFAELSIILPFVCHINSLFYCDGPGVFCHFNIACPPHAMGW